MNFSSEKLTVKSQEAIQSAQRLAVSKGNPEIAGIHLLASLLEETDGNIKPFCPHKPVKTAYGFQTPQASRRLRSRSSPTRLRRDPEPLR